MLRTSNHPKTHFYSVQHNMDPLQAQLHSFHHHTCFPTYKFYASLSALPHSICHAPLVPPGLTVLRHRHLDVINTQLRLALLPRIHGFYYAAVSSEPFSTSCLGPVYCHFAPPCVSQSTPQWMLAGRLHTRGDAYAIYAKSYRNHLFTLSTHSSLQPYASSYLALHHQYDSHSKWTYESSWTSKDALVVGKNAWKA